MRLYIDDDSIHTLLVKLLRKAGHDVIIPADVGLSGRSDPEHLARAVIETRVLLSQNYRDFRKLHDLVGTCHGQHRGILVIRKDNDQKRDMSAKAIVLALGNLIRSGVPVDNGYHILNDYR